MHRATYKGHTHMTVIYMDTARKSIAPKTESVVHLGQRYTLQFDPNAPPECQWVGVIRYTRAFEYIVSAPTNSMGHAACRRQIKQLLDRE